MKEIEVKILDVNPDQIRKKLQLLSAEKRGVYPIESVSLDFPDGRICRNKQLLRVRQIGGKVEVCFKSRKENSSYKVQEETEVQTNNFQDTLLIFKSLGLKIISRERKTRESYLLAGAHVDIDLSEEIPPLVEVEAATEGDVKKVVQQLGLTMKDTTNMTGFEVTQYYRQKHQTRKGIKRD